ncbi:duf974 domain containing protein [Grosmannia clavigera kw1407]|uniref:Duf974 domain containing protein n=1 Tax=Grosmannia clavigera (strain kw1407 / UAMH 11150) TaxID=655863 RepID=F0X7Y1_GROCL|nr:duf974 domain containing protein [Grosmannia clavigera kw1407]EFX06401.1 duf974 domain containing protein [Grosmannia clavigera kw1407]
MAPSARGWLRAVFAVDSVTSGPVPVLPPAFLCPAVWTAQAQRPRLRGPSRQQSQSTWQQVRSQRRFVYSAATAVHDASADDVPAAGLRKLPLQCPGCGAYSQTTQADQAGFFDLGRRSTMEYMGLAVREKPRVREEDRVVEEALRRIDRSALEAQGVDLGGLLWESNSGQELSLREHSDETDGRTKGWPSILCRRCHDLVHHSAGTAIYQPDMDAVRETIAESPYKYNHVYHVLDAADFPMSLLPRIDMLLDTMPLRSRNRRARRGKFFGNRKTELSFVITRADLFAPHKQQVDRMMTWVRETLRDALGRMGRHVRLGNVRCVSARRSWWTTELREEVWQRGGASWLVGKANVGKSNLVHQVFPKGRMGVEKAAPKRLLSLERTSSGSYSLEGVDEEDEDLGEPGLLLPPRPTETNYPQMPVVSAVAGTTASPIRIPFGGGRGELIDLPGLARRGLAEVVAPQHRDDLVMKLRVQPEQEVLKGPWQSLLLGGLVRITPRTPDVVFLTYNFSPLPAHRTLTDKAVAIQQQTSELQVPNLAAVGVGADVRLAGSFALCHDVTRLRAGPITRRDAANIAVDRLPYRVVALDLLIEGCGWVEVVAQVRTKELFRRTERRTESMEQADREDKFGILQTLDLSDTQTGPVAEADYNWPVIDVFSPGGKFVGSRRPLNAWMMCKPPSTWRNGKAGRSRRIIKGERIRVIPYITKTAYSTVCHDEAKLGANDDVGCRPAHLDAAMSHNRYTAHEAKEPHPISLKVLRLSHPSLATQYPVAAPLSTALPPPTVPASIAYGGGGPDSAATNTDPFLLSPVLNLPPSFGSAYVGETFACTLCANHDAADVEDGGWSKEKAASAVASIRDVQIEAEMKTPSAAEPVKLVLGPETDDGDGAGLGLHAGTDLASGQTLQKVVRFDLKEEGNHVLAVTVSYYEATETSGRTRTFRKLYQFICKASLIVRTKAGPYAAGRAGDMRRRWALEAQLENCGEDVIQLERVELELERSLTYDKYDWEDGQKPVLHPGEVEQVCFLLEETGPGLVPEQPNGRLLFGVLGIGWRSEMGNRGFLTTGTLGTRSAR